MRDQARQFVIPVENHPIRSGRASIVHIEVAHNGVFVVGAGHGEIEALVIVVLVRVVVDGLSRLIERVPLGLGGTDVAGPVAGASAGVITALAAFQVLPGRGGGERDGEEEGEEGDDGLDGMDRLVVSSQAAGRRGVRHTLIGNMMTVGWQAVGLLAE